MMRSIKVKLHSVRTSTCCLLAIFLAIPAILFFVSITSLALALPRNLLLSENPDLTFLLVDKTDCQVAVYRGHPKWEMTAAYPCTTGKVPGDKFKERRSEDTNRNLLVYRRLVRERFDRNVRC